MNEVQEENNRLFLKFLDESQPAVMAVADWLRSMGFPVRINPTFKAPTRAEWRDYADGGDLEIAQRIEVKRRSFSFTGREDFPYESFFVCAKHSFDRARPKPHAYVILSSDMAHAGIVYGKDSQLWTVERKQDTRRIGYSQEFYIAPLDSVRWQRIK
jgi:hypothetical protein